MSRDEMASALSDVVEGRVPNDRIALKCVWQEMSAWPFVDQDSEAKSPEQAAAAGREAASSSGVSDYASLAGGEGYQAICQPSGG